MSEPHLVLLLHLIGEGGSIQIKADVASLDAPVYRETNEVYDFDEDDADIPLQSTTQYSNFGAYWAVFTDSASWYLLRPAYVHPCLYERIRLSLSNLHTADMEPYRLDSMQYWLDATSVGWTATNKKGRGNHPPDPMNRGNHPPGSDQTK